MQAIQDETVGFGRESLVSHAQDEPVTFQIGMVGSDGLVIGTDTLGRYAPAGQIPQRLSITKYFGLIRDLSG